MDSMTVELRFLPTHPVDGDSILVDVSVGKAKNTIDYATHGRSEEWKENVLNNQAVKRRTFHIDGNKSNRLNITAQSDGVILDQIFIY